MLGYISSLPKTEQRLIKYGRGKPERHLEVKRERKEKGGEKGREWREAKHGF